MDEEEDIGVGAMTDEKASVALENDRLMLQWKKQMEVIRESGGVDIYE